ncbi:hypothetical protein [Parasitella parasitica]|uniref:HTH psq-type domain-containing protein n=1 Tax=Parasitella parasitica TaxID=35722 RepID=A0A0B7MSH6_9FUNG|nr:hypothetical protein [Parasitella parasitica]
MKSDNHEIEYQSLEELREEITGDMSNVKLNKRRYKKRGVDQVERFIKMPQEEGLSVPKAAAVCGIPRSSAHRIRDEFNDGEGHVLSGTTAIPNAPKPEERFQEHT